MSVDHYENFPVASWLCPPELRPPIIAIYRFARTADDIADEGDARARCSGSPTLAAYRADLAAVAAGRRPRRRWPEVFGAAGRRRSHGTACRSRCSPTCSTPSRRTCVKTRYADRDELLDYCRRSAEPDRPPAAASLRRRRRRSRCARSDAICTALQLTNFWQDLGVDCAPRPPLRAAADCAAPRRRSRGELAGAARQRPGPRARRRARRLGARADARRRAAGAHAPRPRRLGAARSSCRAACASSRRSTACAARPSPTRPTLGWRDAPALAWRALSMRAGARGSRARR